MRTVPTLTATALLIAACGSDDVLQPPTETIAPETTVTDPPTTPDPTDAAPTSTGDAENPATTQPGSMDSSTAMNPTTTGPATTGPTTTGRSTPAQLADIAIDDLMTRIGVERGEIGIRSVDEVTWRDGSIGCPDPDFAYTQALVPGIRVVLDHDGFAYHYHQGGGRELFYCPAPAAPLEISALE